MFNQKKGVSLITVLLFMLVATIAATATFKWLTSENVSSASRMRQQEAYQSAVAGIENARSWMTHHGNEVGAVISQYFTNGKRPLLLNAELIPELNTKQQFNVWVTGVAETGGVYKVKLLSEGKSINGTTHSEVAIVNVSGLYRVDIPIDEPEPVVIPSTFDYSYFGGSMENGGDMNPSSLLINGNWKGNPNIVQKNFIVTGNAELSGDKLDIGGSVCIGGNFNADNGIDANNLYVHGKTTKLKIKSKGLSGTVRFDGDVEQGDGNVIIGGTLAINAKATTKLNGYKFEVGGGLCLGENADVDLKGSTNPFLINGDVWIPGHDNIKVYDNQGSYEKIVLGNSTASKLYIADGHPYSDYAALRTSRTFTEDSDYYKECRDAISQGCYNADAGRNPAWTMWGGSEYSPYISVAGHDDMFYMYHVEPGVKDVDFKYVDDTYWHHGNHYYTTNDWISPTRIGSYFVGGKQFYNFGNGNQNTYHYNNTYFETKRQSPYCIQKGADKFRPECHVFPWFKSNGKLETSMGTTSPFDCGDSLKAVCDGIWKQKPGCDGAQFKVDDVLKTGHTFFEPYAGYGCAAKIKTIDDNFGSLLNECYKRLADDPDKARDSLYNGYLVVKVKSEHKRSPNTALAGHFIIILDNKPTESVAFPPTNDTSKVFVYLTQGTGENSSLQPGNESGKYNYFFFTKNDIGSKNAIGLLFNNTVLDGSVYATASNCSKVAKINTKEMNFNSDLMNSLTSSGILCDISVATCGGRMDPSSASSSASSSAAGGGTSSDGGSGSTNGVDAYYVSIAPQLSISLESEYKSGEAAPNEDGYAVLLPSIVVLPRIIYLPQNPEGTLSDYYNVLNLNGAHEVKEASKVTSCEGGVPRTGPLSADGANLEKGPHKCIYTSPDYGEIPFYVVVGNEVGKIPLVTLTKDEEELVDGGSVDVYANVPKSSHGSVKFDMYVTNVPSGWNINAEPNVVEKTGPDASKKYYTVTVEPSSSGNLQKKLLTITAPGSAADGFVFVVLTTPTEGCDIGIPYSERVFKQGKATIQRRSIGAYCAAFPDDCDETMKQKSLHPDCDALDLVSSVEWIKAQGTLCSYENKNNSWKCMSNTAITLTPGTRVTDNCELIIPSTNNEVIAPENGVSYDLYASLKRKPYQLTINMEGAKDDDTKILVYDDLASNSPAMECKKSEAPCTYTTYYGANITLNHEEVGSDENHFSYWLCSGENCTTRDENREAQSELKYISTNNSVVAKFNQRDHCFYEDFSNTSAFCQGGSVDCIDTCAVRLSKDMKCEVKNSKQEGAKWLMMYNNNGNGTSYAPLIINHQHITISNEQNASNSAGRNSIILSTINAGANGTMTAMLQTSIVKTVESDDMLNSGLIVRSNGSEFLVLSLVGVGNGGSSGPLYARLCKVEGQAVNNINKGCKFAQITNSTLTVGPTTMVKIAADLDDTKIVKISASVGGSTGSAEIDLSGWGEISNAMYVGFDLSDAAFKLYDIGWQSSSFNDDCWDIPTVSCSFASNYLGGRVPKGQDVEPWVGVSSWFEENNCESIYYYNGPDNAYSTSCTGTACASQIGYQTSGNKYNFSQEGNHGVALESGGVEKDARIKMSCPGDVTSLDLANTAYGCGPFWVGGLESCSEDYDILTTETSYYANVETRIEGFTTNGINLRGSDLVLNVNWNTTDPNKVIVYLESEGGNRSLPASITATGTQTLNVDVMSNIEGFDPQKVTAVIVDGLYDFSISAIASHCPYALRIECRSANLDASTGKFEVAVRTTNGDNAKCEVSADNSNWTSESVNEKVDCNQKLYLDYSGTLGDLYNGINTSGLAPVEFTVTATDERGKTKSCQVSSLKIEKAEVTCSISKEIVNQGEGSPSFTFAVGKTSSVCPSDGCPYELSTPNSLPDGKVAPGMPQSVTPITNDASNPASTGSYTVSVTAFGETCTKTFEVVVAPDDPPSNLSCGNDGATLVNNDNVEYTYKIGVARDNLGNLVSGYSSTGTSSATNLEYPEKPTAAGTYYYVVEISYGATKLNCEKEFTVAPALNITCPNSTITGQDPTSVISVTPTVTGCDGGCDWTISPATTDGSGSNYTGGGINFYNVSGSGTVSHTLTVSKGAKSDNCSFNVTYAESSSSGGACIAYVGGASNHANNCFNTGLQNMNEKCYKCNPERGSECSNNWLNDNASDSYWWVETPCNGSGSGSGTASSSSAKSSSSAESSSSIGGGGGSGNIVWKLNGENYPDYQVVTSGDCFDLVGQWTNCCYHPTPRFDCQRVSGSGGIIFTYGGNSWDTNNGNYDHEVGSAFQQTSGEETLVSNVCVTFKNTSDSWKCKFRN